MMLFLPDLNMEDLFKKMFRVHRLLAFLNLTVIEYLELNHTAHQQGSRLTVSRHHRCNFAGRHALILPQATLWYLPGRHDFKLEHLKTCVFCSFRYFRTM